MVLEQVLILLLVLSLAELGASELLTEVVPKLALIELSGLKTLLVA